MGMGLPGGRRQAGRIDYRTEPNSSVLPDRPRRAARLPRAARSRPRLSARCKRLVTNQQWHRPPLQYQWLLFPLLPLLLLRAHKMSVAPGAAGRSGW
jgi:hypothetical protein